MSCFLVEHLKICLQPCASPVPLIGKAKDPIEGRCTWQFQTSWLVLSDDQVMTSVDSKYSSQAVPREL